MTTLAAVVAEARKRLSEAGLPDAAIDARLLVGGLLKLSATEMFVGGDRILSEEEAALLEAAIQRRLKREPVHRILGSREFHGLDLRMSRETLEPRPDTEILVDAMLPYLRQVVATRGSASILDLGTGTGAIVLALLKDVPAAKGVGSDISDDALATAAENARDLGLGERFQTVSSRWFAEIAGRFDIIVSNPPYIPSHVIPGLDPEVRDFDPLAALDGGPDGLAPYRDIAADAAGFLEPDGVLGVEIGFDQKTAVTDIFTSAGFILTQAERDYGGHDRVLVFRPNIVFEPING
jgi:release factor glutamine methyltransferase